MSKAAGPMKKPIREFIRYSQWKIPEVNCGIASMCFVLKKQQKYKDRYKLDPSNDYEELAQEQNIALANFRRKKLSQTGIRGSNGNIKYLTFDEASYLAKVSRSMINKWADKGKFTVIKVGSRVRIRRDEFEDWMEQRDLERSMQ